MPTIKKISLNGTTYDLGGGLTEDVKQASLQIAEKVAYIDEHGQDYYDDLYDAFYPPIPATSVTLSSNSLSFSTLGTTQTLTATVLPVDTTDTVSWTSSDQSVATVSNGVVTSVGYGSATITATVGNVSATCSVVIAQATVVSISAVYTQSGTVYDTDTLDSLKADLVVTATFNDSSTEVVPSEDYTLTGTLTEGTSTITVEYGDQTATFNVSVTKLWDIDWDYTMGDPTQQGFSSETSSGGSAINTNEGFKLAATSGSASLIPSPVFVANHGKVEIEFVIKTMPSSFQGLVFIGSTGSQGFRVRCYNSGLYWGASANTAATDEKIANVYRDNRYRIVFEWSENGVTVELDGEIVKTGEFTSTSNRTVITAISPTVALIKAFRLKEVG